MQTERQTLVEERTNSGSVERLSTGVHGRPRGIGSFINMSRSCFYSGSKGGQISQMVTCHCWYIFLFVKSVYVCMCTCIFYKPFHFNPDQRPDKNFVIESHQSLCSVILNKRLSPPKHTNHRKHIPTKPCCC